MIRSRAIKGRPVPGALVYAFAEGLLLPTMQDTGLAFLNATLDVKGPTVVGDTIHVEAEVVEARLTSKGDRGLVRFANKVVNQDGQHGARIQPAAHAEEEVMIDHIDHVVLTTRDLPACLRFYSDILGMKHEKFQTPDRDPHRAEIRQPEDQRARVGQGVHAARARRRARDAGSVFHCVGFA